MLGTGIGNFTFREGKPISGSANVFRFTLGNCGKGIAAVGIGSFAFKPGNPMSGRANVFRIKLGSAGNGMLGIANGRLNSHAREKP